MAMVFIMIMIDISKYDKLLEDLKAMLFSERKSRKLNRIEPNFYKNIHSLFVELTEEKGSTALGIKFKDGVLLLSEKKARSRLVENYDEIFHRIFEEVPFRIYRKEFFDR